MNMNYEPAFQILDFLNATNRLVWSAADRDEFLAWISSDATRADTWSVLRENHGIDDGGLIELGLGEHDVVVPLAAADQVLRVNGGNPPDNDEPDVGQLNSFDHFQRVADMLSPVEIVQFLVHYCRHHQLGAVPELLTQALRAPEGATLYDEHFGTCPECFDTDGYINIGRGHWFYCAEHKTCWFVGSNLFSAWREQTEAEQRQDYDDLGFAEFRQVKPAWFALTPPPQPSSSDPSDTVAPF